MYYICGMTEIVQTAKIDLHTQIFGTRRRKGISNYRLAELSGVTRGTIKRYEDNPNYNITIDNLLALATALELERLQFIFPS